MGRCQRARWKAHGLSPMAYRLSVIAEVSSQRRRAVAGRLLVALPVRPELLRLQRANREADLPLLRSELDDLHRVGFTHLQLDLLLVLRGVPRIVELRHVNEPFDSLV